jgi:site-specific DNA recombinase
MFEPKPGARAIVYLRVSTSKQERNGLSLAAQEHQARAWARARNLPVQVFRDTASGASETRPGWKSALAELREGDALVVQRLDRAARTIKQAVFLGEKLARDGVELVSLNEAIDTTSPAGRLLFFVMSALAQFEREQTRARVLSHNEQRRAEGKPIAGTPRYGQRCERERAAATLAREMRAEGSTLQTIAWELTERGYAPRGKCWHAESVKRLVSAAPA